ncbi:MAG TPA: class I SAM-dependent methyltransferase [Acidobacteriota bacterium]
MISEKYISGKYLQNNPSWHAEESPYKAMNILKILERNQLVPRSICEIGCGSGEILKQLQMKMDKKCTFTGYEVSPQAFKLCQKRRNSKLRFRLKDILREKGSPFDLILVLDVIEHLEDYFTFLRKIKSKSAYKIIQIPLEINLFHLIKDSFVTFRDTVGHLHFFNDQMIFRILKETGYEIIDFLYADYLDLPHQPLLYRLFGPGRNLVFRINKSWGARLGGYSLMVLVK